MSKLSKRDMYKEIKSITKGAASSEKIGSIGQGIVRFGGHAGLALASTTMDKGFFGIDMLRPDTLALGLAGLTYFATRKKKGGLHKTSRSGAAAAMHAIITRLVVKSRSLLIHGPDGWHFKQG
jgi:hypothetical protein